MVTFLTCRRCGVTVDVTSEIVSYEQAGKLYCDDCSNSIERSISQIARKGRVTVD